MLFVLKRFVLILSLCTALGGLATSQAIAEVKTPEQVVAKLTLKHLGSGFSEGWEQDNGARDRFSAFSEKLTAAIRADLAQTRYRKGGLKATRAAALRWVHALSQEGCIEAATRFNVHLGGIDLPEFHPLHQPFMEDKYAAMYQFFGMLQDAGYTVSEIARIERAFHVLDVTIDVDLGLQTPSQADWMGYILKRTHSAYEFAEVLATLARLHRNSYVGPSDQTTRVLKYPGVAAHMKALGIKGYRNPEKLLCVWGLI